MSALLARWGGLHVLADDDPRWPRDPVDQALAACAGGAAVVQLRAKLATDRAALAWGEAIRAATRRAGALFCVNDRIDLALACGADGVHLGQDDVPPARIPPDWRARIAIGRSTHTRGAGRARVRARRSTTSRSARCSRRARKSSRSARAASPRSRDAVARAAPRPVVAIGGIDASRVAEVRAAGAAGFAVISAVAGAASPEAAVRELARVASFAQRGEAERSPMAA